MQGTMIRTSYLEFLGQLISIKKFKHDGECQIVQEHCFVTSSIKD